MALNPNRLEFIGNRVVVNRFRKWSHSVCLTRPVCSVITVNQVQSTFEVPVYSVGGGDLNTLNSYLLPLSSLRNDNGDKSEVMNASPSRVFDYSKYRNNSYTAVHIDDLFLSPPDLQTSTVGKQTLPAVSVVLPIANGEEFLHRCLESLLEQQYKGLEVLCVLNGCSDNSAVISSSFVEAFSAAGMCLKVIQLPSRGLVAALNKGIAEATGEFICRMDADDVLVSPCRVQRQAEFLTTHPEINVLGTQSFLSLHGDEARHQFNSLAGGIPTDPVLAQWEMLFRCVILHPTVMFRKHAIVCCGLYQDFISIPPAACLEGFSDVERSKLCGSQVPCCVEDVRALGRSAAVISLQCDQPAQRGDESAAAQRL